jgi:hypothetical protein
VLDRLGVVARTFLASTLKRCRGGRDIVEARTCAVTADVGAAEARGTASTHQRQCCSLSAARVASCVGQEIMRSETEERETPEFCGEMPPQNSDVIS